MLQVKKDAPEQTSSQWILVASHVHVHAVVLAMQASKERGDLMMGGAYTDLGGVRVCCVLSRAYLARLLLTLTLAAFP